MDIRSAIRIIEGMGRIVNEGLYLDGFVELAKKYDTVERFIKATDGMDVLYRGHSGDDHVENNSFMTDYVGHAQNYIDDTGKVSAYAVDWSDMLFFKDERFDEMRRFFLAMNAKEFAAAYAKALSGNRFAVEFEGSRGRRLCLKMLQSKKPYSTLIPNIEMNDATIPLMQMYAREQFGKNIIAFVGSDYAEYDGQNEFVVGDISKLVDLRALYDRVRTEMNDKSADALEENAASHRCLTVYRGENSTNKNGNFWTEDKEFALQFTQSGLEREVLVRYMFPGDIYEKSIDTYAGDEAGVDAALEKAKELDYKAVRLNEGSGEPPSIFVFDKSALMRMPRKL